MRYMRIATKGGGYIGKGTILKGCTILQHGFHGIHISRFAEIENNVRIFQDVTIGSSKEKASTIGENVTIGAGAIIIGDVTVRNNVFIGDGTIITKNVPKRLCCYF